MLFNIITITKNYNEGFIRTLDSVRCQERNHEIEIRHLICNGDPDDLEFKSLSESFRGNEFLISNEDTGIYNAMNKGLSKVIDGWIIFLNAGDILEDEFVIIKLAKYLSKNESKIIQAKSVYPNGQILPRKKYHWFDLYFGFEMHVHPSLIFHTSSIEKVTYDESYNIAADFKLAIQLNQRFKFNFIDLVVSRFEGGGISSRNQSDTIEEMNRVRFETKPKFMPIKMIEIWNVWVSYRTLALSKRGRNDLK